MDQAPIGPKPTWGDAVRVKQRASAEARPGSLASVCGLGRVETVAQAERHGVVVGTVLYVVEFPDGATAEVPEPWIEPAYTKTTDEWLDRNVRLFQEILCAAWSNAQQAEPLHDPGGFLREWITANWEMLVEGPLVASDQIFLDVYGGNPRVFRPGALATHRVGCVSKSGEKMFDVLNQIGIATPFVPLRELVTMVEGSYYATLPFDCVLVDDGGIERVVLLDDVRFELRTL